MEEESKQRHGQHEQRRSAGDDEALAHLPGHHEVSEEDEDSAPEAKRGRGRSGSIVHPGLVHGDSKDGSSGSSGHSHGGASLEDTDEEGTEEDASRNDSKEGHPAVDDSVDAHLPGTHDISDDDE